MKKFYYLIAMAIMAFTFTSCEDVPAPFGQPVHISGDTEDDPSGGDDSGLAVNEDFKAAGKLTWTVTNVVAPDGIDVWQYDSRYGLKATAYAGGANNAAESWLICPEPYNFSNVSGAKMTIKHAANYFSDGAEKECKVLASTDYSKSVADATWTEIKIDTWPTSWDFVEGTGDMSAFDGKDKVYIAFKYTSTATKSGTWEIESLKVEGGGSSSGGGDTPTPSSNYGTAEAPLTVAQALEVINGLEDNGTASPAYVKGKISKVQSFNDKYKSITYYISDDGTDNNALQVYSGKGIDGADFAAQTDLETGWTVVVTGELKKYVNSNTGAVTLEINQSSKIVSIDKTAGSGSDTPTSGYGTATAPLTVAKALEIINGLEDNGTVSDAYVKGKISKVQSFNNKYKSITYYISDDGTDNNALQVYSGKGIDGADFAAQTDLETGWTVVVTGELKKYVNSNTGAVTLEINQSSKIVSIDKTGSGSDTPSGTVGLDVTFDAGKATFTIEDKSIGDGITYVWSEDTTNKYMKASAYKGGAIAAESWLISPKFSLKTLTAPVLTFNNACNQVKTGVITDHIHVMVSTDGTNWTEATIANMPSGTNWTFVDSTVDMKTYAGKENVQIAFKYISTTSIAPTWEIKSVSVK